MGLTPPSEAPLVAQCELFKDRCATLCHLAEWLAAYYGPVSVPESEGAQHLTDAVRPAVHALALALNDAEWTKEGVSAAFKSVLSAHGLKMPQLAIPVRVAVFGKTQTPAIDQSLALFDRKILIERLQSV
jgi:glutamyl-tRNA synthetase